VVTVSDDRMAIVAMARVPVRRPIVLGDEHRRQVFQTVFGFDSREMAAMGDQLIGHLINDERGVILRREGIESVLQKFAFLLGL
jgi:hypothetical protein